MIDIIYLVGAAWGFWYGTRMLAYWFADDFHQPAPEVPDWTVAIFISLVVFTWAWPVLLLGRIGYVLITKYSKTQSSGMNMLFPRLKNVETKEEKAERKNRELREENSRLQHQIDMMDRELGLGPYKGRIRNG